jgi:hypothetical protein
MEQPFYEEEFGDLPVDGCRENKLTPHRELLAKTPDPLDAIEAPKGAATEVRAARVHSTAYDCYVAPGSTGPLRVVLHFAVGPELGRHGLRTFFVNRPNTALIVISGIEKRWPGTTGVAWAKSITRSLIDEAIELATGNASLKGTWTVEVVTGYSTGYRGLVAALTHALPSKSGPAPALDLPLAGLKRIVFYDALYLTNDRPPHYRTADALDAAGAAAPDAEIVAYVMTGAGHNPAALALVPPLRKTPPAKGLTINLLAKASELRVLFHARIMNNAVADGYFTRARVPDAYLPVMDVLPTRGTFCSSPAVLAALAPETSAGKVLVTDFIAAHAAIIIAAAQDAVQTEVHRLIRWFRLAGWNPELGELSHDMFVPEFAWEKLPP